MEIDGVLRSWAIPKNIPPIPGIRRLAIPVEDHPLSYIDFEGEISKGKYGAGTVKIHDNGIYQLIIHSEGKLVFILDGKRFSGKYEMIKFRENWLIFKN